MLSAALRRADPARFRVAVRLTRSTLKALRVLPCLGLLLFGPPAYALTRQEAIVVVKLVQALSPEFGKLAYDDTAADDWFEADAESDRRISRAGFTQETWKTALDATVTGYVATLPEDEFRAILATLRANAENRGSLTAAQRRARLEWGDEGILRLETMRAEGAPYAEIVRPLAPRLRKLMVE
ncbi:MAG: hypothetical protein P0Y66_19260 [Candidatus Kaistia colombiensis]|nr:MAG: hypothetical protein P0Y66_19260 [Kaistia sp.]